MSGAPAAQLANNGIPLNYQESTGMKPKQALLRDCAGATLSLGIALVFLLTALGIFFYMGVCLLSGSSEVGCATDAAVLNAGRQIIAVSLPNSPTTDSSEITASRLPLAFRALAVNADGSPAQLRQDSNGNWLPPDNALLNLSAFNRAAALTWQVALNAAEENSNGHSSPQALANANALIDALSQYGKALNDAISKSTKVSDALNLAQKEQTNFLNVLGARTPIQLVPDTSSEAAANGLDFARVSGKSNTYFHPSTYKNDGLLSKWIAASTVSSGLKSQTTASYSANDGNYQSGQPFIPAYTKLDPTAITGVSGFTGTISFASTSPGQTPHLINTNEFSTAVNPSSSDDYAPVNAVQAMIATTITRGSSDAENANEQAVGVIAKKGKAEPVSRYTNPSGGSNVSGGTTPSSNEEANDSVSKIKSDYKPASGKNAISLVADTNAGGSGTSSTLDAESVSTKTTTTKETTASPKTSSKKTAKYSTPKSKAKAVAAGSKESKDEPAAGKHASAKLLVSAKAAAVASSLDNEYAASNPTGYVVINNLPDAIVANPSIGTVPYTLNDADSIFNRELYQGVGGLGGINFVLYHTNTGLLYSTANGDPSNGIFATEDWEGLNSAPAPVSNYSSEQEIQAWIDYDNSSGDDANQHDPALYPPKVLGYATPSANLRTASAGQASLNDVLQLAGQTITNANTYSSCFGSGAAAASPNNPILANFYNVWNASYYPGVYYGTTAYDGVVTTDSGQFSTGGLTNLECLKGEVIQGWFDMISPTGGWRNSYTFSPQIPAQPSGVRQYDRTNATGYAAPSNTNGKIGFGTTTTPYNLIKNQIFAYTSSNSARTNIDDTSSPSSPWNDVTTPLGKLLQQAQQISPKTTAASLITLLQKYDLDLGQSQYIYLPTGGSSLIISQSPPPWVTKASTPDGQALPACSNDVWDNTMGTVINSQMHEGTVTPNIAGDAGTHDMIFTSWSSPTTSPSISNNIAIQDKSSSGSDNIATQDSYTFTPSSGYDGATGNNLLGELQLYQTVAPDDCILALQSTINSLKAQSIVNTQGDCSPGFGNPN